MDVGDAGGDDALRRVGEQQARVGEDVLAADTLGDPGGRVADLLELPGGCDLVVGRQALEREAPDARWAEQLCQVAAAEAAEAVQSITPITAGMIARRELVRG